MDERYEKHTPDRTDRCLIGLAFMLGIPAVIVAFDVAPESVGHVFAVAAGLLAIFIPTNMAGIQLHTMLGSSATITFLTGSDDELKDPCSSKRSDSSGDSQEHGRGDTVATIGMAYRHRTIIIVG